MPVVPGEKSPAERFPGAVATWTIEAMMQDRKALQAGTSHFLGQNFAKASEIKFLNPEGVLEYAWTTSWGVSTRLIGGLLMTHSDDDGLVLPPKLAPAHVVIMPVTGRADDPEAVLAYCRKLRDDLRAQRFGDRNVEVEFDDRDIRGGEKAWQWIKRGIPLRVEVGPRDMADDAVFVGRRDQSPKDKKSVPRSAFIEGIADTLQSMQDGLYARAKQHVDTHTREIDDETAFRAFFTPKDAAQPEIHGGFALTHWSGDAEVEARIKQELGVTIRCLPIDRSAPGTCPFTGQPSPQRALWAKSY